MVQSSQRIDPKEIQAQVKSGKAQAMNPNSSFAPALEAAGAMAPFVGETTAQSTGNVNAAAVMHAAFTASPFLAGVGNMPGYGAGQMYGGMDEMGVMGFPKYNTVNPAAYGTGDAAGLGVPQSQLIDKMNSNNLQLLGLQATLQNNMQSWTTKSNVLKSSYEAKMNMIQKFATR